MDDPLEPIEMLEPSSATLSSCGDGPGRILEPRAVVWAPSQPRWLAGIAAFGLLALVVGVVAIRARHGEVTADDAMNRAIANLRGPTSYQYHFRSVSGDYLADVDRGDLGQEEWGTVVGSDWRVRPVHGTIDLATDDDVVHVAGKTYHRPRSYSPSDLVSGSDGADDGIDRVGPSWMAGPVGMGTSSLARLVLELGLGAPPTMVELLEEMAAFDVRVSERAADGLVLTADLRFSVDQLSDALDEQGVVTTADGDDADDAVPDSASIRLVMTPDGIPRHLRLSTKRDQTVVRATVEFNRWGERLAIEAPPADDTDLTPWLDDVLLSWARHAFTPRLPSRVPAGLELVYLGGWVTGPGCGFLQFTYESADRRFSIDVWNAPRSCVDPAEGEPFSTGRFGDVPSRSSPSHTSAVQLLFGEVVVTIDGFAGQGELDLDDLVASMEVVDLDDAVRTVTPPMRDAWLKRNAEE